MKGRLHALNIEASLELDEKSVRALHLITRWPGEFASAWKKAHPSLDGLQRDEVETLFMDLHKATSQILDQMDRARVQFTPPEDRSR